MHETGRCREKNGQKQAHQCSILFSSPCYWFECLIGKASLAVLKDSFIFACTAVSAGCQKPSTFSPQVAKVRVFLLLPFSVPV